ncbi:MAG TPA: DUF2304 domain-containing protein [Solirubrobacteraceae bacterium]|nr:DUF2304 domain-containing protein [Solirubrobacteraceae bacterium]
MAIVGAAVLLLTVLELVRRRRLMERYALLWLLSAVVLLALAIWSSALASISHAIGVIYPPNALFFIAIGFILLLLLHFSSAVSRLSDQTETLAQRQALLDERLRLQEEPTDDIQPERGAEAEAEAELEGKPLDLAQRHLD